MQRADRPTARAYHWIGDEPCIAAADLRLLPLRAYPASKRPRWDRSAPMTSWGGKHPRLGSALATHINRPREHPGPHGSMAAAAPLRATERPAAPSSPGVRGIGRAGTAVAE